MSLLQSHWGVLTMCSHTQVFKLFCKERYFNHYLSWVLFLFSLSSLPPREHWSGIKIFIRIGWEEIELRTDLIQDYWDWLMRFKIMLWIFLLTARDRKGFTEYSFHHCTPTHQHYDPKLQDQRHITVQPCAVAARTIKLHAGSKRRQVWNTQYRNLVCGRFCQVSSM